MGQKVRQPFRLKSLPFVLLLSGICTMICINHMEISDPEALTMVSETVQDMIERRKRL